MRIKTNCPASLDIAASSAYYIHKALLDLGYEVEGSDQNYKDCDCVVNISGQPLIDTKGLPNVLWDTDSFLGKVKGFVYEYVSDINSNSFVFIGGSPEDLEFYPPEVEFLPHAFDEDIHKPVDVIKDYDLVMIGKKGNMYEERMRLVDLLKQHFTVLDIETDPGNDYVNAMSRGRLIFNRSLGNKNIPMRFFEGMALGALVENYNDNLDPLATEGKHYIGYNNDKELIDKVKYYLDRDRKIEKMRKDARKHALANHTYKHRARKIVKKLKQML